MTGCQHFLLRHIENIAVHAVHICFIRQVRQRFKRFATLMVDQARQLFQRLPTSQLFFHLARSFNCPYSHIRRNTPLRLLLGGCGTNPSRSIIAGLSDQGKSHRSLTESSAFELFRYRCRIPPQPEKSKASEGREKGKMARVHVPKRRWYLE